MKALRLERHWSQEQLAHLSGLNVRTIQRVEKGQKAGSETLKSLAAVFEISIEELNAVIGHESQVGDDELVVEDKDNSRYKQAQEKIKSKKYFYGLSGLLTLIFLLLMLPNYNGGENLAPLIVVFLSFATIIIGLAIHVFQPFGEEWEEDQITQLLARKNRKEHSDLDT
ncbi:helix-turn-helix transcriptional regulator [uncultured Umboniibacter sp.]|uniref:helix-turn-helix domain-containing protein n=1 Tax=uncultured Umboniibacter sp. TaxID=1798917 RepID=UPI0026275118|nr:helix-turn-helix transcriptional regulator [uncultured Umboniibacter sp.]